MTNRYTEYKVSSINIIILDLHTTCMEVIFWWLRHAGCCFMYKIYSSCKNNGSF